MSGLTFYSDPGHGWLEVPRSEVERVGVLPTISAYSYQSADGQTLYLEEDRDATAYLVALEKRGEQPGPFRYVNEDRDESFVRSLPGFRP